MTTNDDPNLGLDATMVSGETLASARSTQCGVGRHAEAITTISAAYRDAQAESPRDESLVTRLREWLDAHPKP